MYLFVTGSEAPFQVLQSRLMDTLALASNSAILKPIIHTWDDALLKVALNLLFCTFQRRAMLVYRYLALPRSFPGWLEDCLPQFFALLRRLRHVYLGLQSFLRNYSGIRTKTSQFSHLDNISPRLSVFRHFQEGFERRPQRKTYQNMVGGTRAHLSMGLHCFSLANLLRSV